MVDWSFQRSVQDRWSSSAPSLNLRLPSALLRDKGALAGKVETDAPWAVRNIFAEIWARGTQRLLGDGTP